MILAKIPKKIRHSERQQIQLQGINLTENYAIGEMESCGNITSDHFPYIQTADRKQIVSTGIPEGYQPISIFAWEKLFVVSDEPHEGGYKCYYGGTYCGDCKNLTIPKQYAVLNSKLVVWPDKIYFDLYGSRMKAHDLGEAQLIHTVRTGPISYRKAVTE